MRLFRVFIIIFVFVVSADAQTRKTSTAKPQPRTSKASARSGKTPVRTNQTGKTSTTKNKTASSQKKTTSQKPAGNNVSVKGLQNESAQIKKNIKQQEQRLRSNERDVKQRLQNLMAINTEIEDKRKTIDTIRRDINALNSDIIVLDKQLKKLEKELADRKDRYVKSMRYMHRNSCIQNQLMFVFSAKNFTQMYRRLRFTREYAAYQRAQGEMVKETQKEVTAKYNELTAAKKQKNTLLTKGEQERLNLENKQTEQQQMVNTLQKQQKTIQKLIEEQRKKEAALNAQIDKLIAEEMERARQRAIAEAKRKAEAEAARKRAAEQAGREGERKGKNDSKSSTRDNGKSQKSDDIVYKMDSEDRRIAGGFESNRGRMPIPITGPYRIVNRYGQYEVDGLKGVRLDNKGINIEGQAGAQARSIFEGVVSAIYSASDGTKVIMVRHGNYISVYCNLLSTSVRMGQKVKTRQVLGTVGSDHILPFQLRLEKVKLNPEAWLGR